MQLHILIPSGDMVHADFMVSLNQMITYIFTTPFTKDECTIRVTNLRGSLIHMSREEMVATALLGGATHILFLDSDMTFPEDAFHRLFSRNEPLVAANYVKRCLPTSPNAVTLMSQPLFTLPDSTGLEECQSVGAGLMLIKAEVFESMPRPWFDTYWFEDDEGNRRMIGEDVYFCHKAKAAGFKTMIDHDVSQNVGHVGTFEFIHPMAQIDVVD
jgi:hypothetical protein